jgi:hypothetical protein
MVHSRHGAFWEWTILGMVVLGMIVLGLVQVPLHFVILGFVAQKTFFCD